MTTLTIEISETLDAQLALLAERSSTSKQIIAAQALREFLRRQTNVSSSKTIADVTGHLFGTVDGDAPRDLSTNKKHLRIGMK
jgi:hypothetical protein